MTFPSDYYYMTTCTTAISLAVFTSLLCSTVPPADLARLEALMEEP